MKVKTSEICPKCMSVINYNRTNLKNFQTKNGRIKCRKCGCLVPKETSDKIFKNLVTKRLLH